MNTQRFVSLLPPLAMALLLVAAGCQKETEDTKPIVTPQPKLSDYLNIDLSNLDNFANNTYPVHYDANIFNAFDNTPVDNAITDKGATLGKVLFYDKNLSYNKTTACASCHRQELGFTDSEKLSVGFEGGLTGAHSMRLGNVRFYAGEKMFWDLRAASVEDQSTRPIKDGTEMGFDATHGGFDALIARMDQLPYYPELFTFVYGDATITEEKVQKALAQFVRSIESYHSRFDEGFALVFNRNVPNGNLNAPFPNFTTEENRGKELFISPPNQGGGGCIGCHQAPTFALNAISHSNGLDAGETKIFKSPSLKNIAVTGPYMHDGRFKTLMEVIEHYNSGVQLGPALDGKLRTPNGQPLRLQLTQNDKEALVAFLNTLTDQSLNTDTKFSNPFK